MNVWTKYARLAIAVPLLAIPLFATSASAAAGPATVSGKAAVGAGDVFWFLNGSTGGGKGGGGGPGTFMALTCDGTTVNTGAITVTPDTFTDPFTAALHNGPANATFSGQVCSFSYFGASCDSAGPASFAIKI